MNESETTEPVAALKAIVLPKRRTQWKPPSVEKQAQTKTNTRIRRIMKVTPKPKENGSMQVVNHEKKDEGKEHDEDVMKEKKSKDKKKKKEPKGKKRAAEPINKKNSAKKSKKKMKQNESEEESEYNIDSSS